MNDFHFIRPFWLLVILPAMLFIYWLWHKKLKSGSWAAYCDAELLPFLLEQYSGKHNRWYLILGSVCTFLLILALACPTWQRIPAPVFRNEAALVIALNVNASMDAADIKPSRLSMARYKIADILKQRKDGQTALIAYTDQAFTVTPLTNDTNTIQSQLDALSTDIMPNTGNNIAAALEKSVLLLKQSGLQSGQILLITDSVDDSAFSAAKKLDNYQLSVLGVGTTTGAPIAIEGGFVKDRQGAIVVSRLDTDNLSKLAQTGNGTYQTITADDSDVQNLTSGFNQPIKQKGSKKTDIQLDQWEEQGIWLVLLVLPFGALFFRKGLLVVGLVLLLPFPNDSYAFDWQNLWQTSDQQAYEAYQNKDYKTAAEKFTDNEWQAAAHYQAGNYEKALNLYQNKTEKTANDWYNQGNALAQLGRSDEAIAAYQKTLELNPNDEDAKYNKALLEKQQQEQEQQQQQNQQGSKKTEQNAKEQQKQGQQQKAEQEQSEQQQQNAESLENEQKPEQKDEKSQKDLEQQEKKQKAEQQTERKQTQHKQQNEKTEQAATKPEVKKDENQQVNEQWLNRIPDDPAGLLRRKFKYQYGR